MGPGFRWTITLTPDEQEAYRWMRRETPRDAIVQMDPIAHGRETWSQLPTFAWRRMAAARPISLMNIPDYAERSRRAHRIYAEQNRRHRRAARARARNRLHLHRTGRSAGQPCGLAGEVRHTRTTCSSPSSRTPVRASTRFAPDVASNARCVTRCASIQRVAERRWARPVADPEMPIGRAGERAGISAGHGLRRSQPRIRPA